MLTKRAFRFLAIGFSLVALVLGAFACGSDDDGPAPLVQDVYLVGQVYDGALGARLSGYQLSVTYRDQTLPAEIGADGRFVVRSLPVFQDYTVEVKADGYRPFRSHNAGFNIPNPMNAASPPMSSSQTFYFDAYLFPKDLPTPAVSLTVRKGTSTGELVPSGKARVRPIALSTLADTTAETPAGVGSQLWTNDEDLQAKPLTKDVTSGKLEIGASELVYGVRYLVSIYEVAGYQAFEGQFTAGVDGPKTYVLAEESADPLTLVITNASSCRTAVSSNETQGAVVTFEFNVDIEFTTTSYPGGNAELIDDGLTMVSSNVGTADGGAALVNTLASDLSSSAQERGTTAVITGRTLTLSWNPSVGLATKDPADVITSTRYNISNVSIQPVGKPTQTRPLSNFNPSGTTITCN